MRYILALLCSIPSLFLKAQNDDRLIFPSDLIWKKQISIDSMIIPSNITGANLKGEVYMFPGQKESFLLYINGIAPYYPSVYTNKFCHVDSSGKIKEMKIKNLNLMLKEEEPIISKGNENLYFFINDSILSVDDKWTSHLFSMGSLNILDLPNNQQLLVAYNDSGKTIMKTSFPGKTEYSVILYKTTGFNKLEGYAILPISSSILDEAIIRSDAQNYGLMLNNTILRGPDHHDLNLYAIDHNFNKLWEHHLTGKSMLGMIRGQDMVLDSAGNMIVIGYANDNNVSFTDSAYDQAFPQFFPDPKPYYFIATYNPNGTLIGLHKFVVEQQYSGDENRFKILSFSKKYLSFYNQYKPEIYKYDRDFENLLECSIQTDSVDLNNSLYTRILFVTDSTFYRIRSFEAPLNTSHPPVFEIEKRVMPYTSY